jgi:hypothetical protein
MTSIIPIRVPKKYECPVCYELLEEPMQSVPCGHNICKSCVVALSPPRCPLCMRNCSFFPDIRLKRELDNEIIECTKCSEKIVFSQYQVHFTQKCPNNMIECKLCKETISYNDFLIHSKICKKFSVQCKCTAILKRDDLALHKKYYCSLSQECVHINCEICGKNVPITRFQSHYEQDHLKNVKTLQIVPRLTFSFEF